MSNTVAPPAPVPPRRVIMLTAPPSEFGPRCDALPLNSLRQANRDLVEEVLDDIALYRRLPTVRCEMTPEVYSYFRSNPDMAVGIWHAMGISNMELEQRSTYSYQMATGDGTLELGTVRPEGKRIVTARELVAGNRVRVGDVLR